MFAFCYILGRVLRGDVTITTIDLSCVKIMSEKLHSEYRILRASLSASFALFSQKLREWQHQSAYFFNTPRIYLIQPKSHLIQYRLTLMFHKS